MLDPASNQKVHLICFFFYLIGILIWYFGQAKNQKCRYGNFEGLIKVLRFLHCTNLFQESPGQDWNRKFTESVIRYECTVGTTLIVSIRLIPQGTVDNNIGPDRLEGPKALDPNYCRQPTLWLHDLCLEVLTVHVTELRLFGAKHREMKREQKSGKNSKEMRKG